MSDTDRAWPPPIKVTEHFEVREFSQPAGYGQPETTYPSEWIADRLVPLCQLLEVLRAEFGGGPLTIIGAGGYRTKEYDLARIAAHDGHCGIAPNSQHHEGMAADVRAAGHTAEEIHAVALMLHRAGKIRLGGLGLYRGEQFVHLDIRAGDHLAQWEG